MWYWELEIAALSFRVKLFYIMIQHQEKPGFHYFFIDELFGDQYYQTRIGSGLGLSAGCCPKLCLYTWSPVAILAGLGSVFESMIITILIVAMWMADRLWLPVSDQGQPVTRRIRSMPKPALSRGDCTQTPERLTSMKRRILVFESGEECKENE